MNTSAFWWIFNNVYDVTSKTFLKQIFCELSKINSFWSWCITITRLLFWSFSTILCVFQGALFQKLVRFLLPSVSVEQRIYLYCLILMSVKCILCSNHLLVSIDGPNGVGTIPFLHLVVTETVPVSETLLEKTMMNCAQHNSPSYFVNCFSIRQSQYLESLYKEVGRYYEFNHFVSVYIYITLLLVCVYDSVPFLLLKML